MWQTLWRLRLVISLVLMVLALWARATGAHADTLPGLSSAATAACPDCTSSAGGADVVNFGEKAIDAMGRTPDYVPPDAPTRTSTPLWDGYESFLANAANNSASNAVAADAMDALATGGEIAAPAVGAAVGPVALTVGAGLATGYGIGTAGKWLVGKIFGGDASSTSGGTTYPLVSQSMRWITGNANNTWSAFVDSGMVQTAATVPATAPAGGIFVYTFRVRNGTGGSVIATDWQTIHDSNNFQAQLGPTDNPFPHYVAPLTRNGTSDTNNRLDYKTYGEATGKGGLVPASSLPSGYASVAPPAQSSEPSRAQIATSMANELNKDPSNFGQWVESQITHNPALDPTVDNVTFDYSMCKTSFAVCQTALQAAGLTGTVTKQALDFDHADETKGANAPTRLQLNGGSFVALPKTGTVTIPKTSPAVVEVNPDVDQMPLRVPQIKPGEKGADYMSDLQTAGFTNAHLNDASEQDTDLDYGPNAATRVAPDAGSKAHASDDVEVTENPSDAPVPAGAPAGGCGLTPPSGSFNFGPLENLNLGSVFPFSVLSWLSSSVAGIAGPDSAPDLPSISVFGWSVTPDGGGFTTFGPLITTLRTLLSISMWLGVGWFLWSRTLGR